MSRRNRNPRSGAAVYCYSTPATLPRRFPVSPALLDEVRTFAADPTPRVEVVRAALPAPSAALFRCDDGRVLVLADERVADDQVERLRMAGAVLVDLPH